MMSDWQCPHCGKDEGTWFDRSMSYNSDGSENEHETFPTRCNACGKNIDAPKEYYGTNTASPDTAEPNKKGVPLNEMQLRCRVRYLEMALESIRDEGFSGRACAELARRTLEDE